MERWQIALVVFAATAVISALLVFLAIPLLRGAGFMDPVLPRKVHKTPVPRGAGVAIFLAFASGIALTFALDVQRFQAERERIWLLLAGSAFITAVMLLDDRGGLNPRLKLAAQIAAGLIVVLPRVQGEGRGIVIDQFNAPIWGQVAVPLAIALPFTLFWIVGMMNTLNFVDGLDGLAATVTLVACGVLFLHTYFWPRENPQFTVSLIPLALAAAVVGFLPFNWHPAKVIMGDAGANFLGFALAVAAIIGGAKIATALLALGLPILDVAWVILYRISHARSPVHADRGHLHHRLLDNGWSQSRIVLFVAGVSAVAGMASLLLPTRGAKLGAILLLGVMLLATVAKLAFDDRRRSSAPDGAADGQAV